MDMSVENTIEMQRTMIKNTEEVVTLRFDEIKNMGIELSYNEQFRALVLKDMNLEEDYYQIMETWNIFKNRQINNKFIYDYYIYFREGDFIVSPNQVDSNLETYYDMFLNYSDMDYDEWYDIYIGSYHYNTVLPLQEIRINDIDLSAMTYVSSLPIDYNNNYGAVLIVLIDYEMLNSYLTSMPDGNQGFTYILDEKGDVLVSSNTDQRHLMGLQYNYDTGYEEVKIDDEEMLVVYTNDNDYGWTFVSVMSKERILKEVNVIAMNTQWAAIAIIILIVFVAVLFGYYNSRPVNTLAELLKRHSGVEEQLHTNQLSMIERMIGNVLKSNDELKSTVDSQLPMLRDLTMFKLINGDFQNEEEILAELGTYGVTIRSGWHCVAVLRIGGYFSELSDSAVEELNMQRLISKSVIAENLADKGHVFYIGDNKLAVLFSGAGAKADLKSEIQEKLNRILSDLRYQHNVMAIVALGNLYSVIGDVHQSMKEANKVLDSVMFKKDLRICWYEDVLEKEEISITYSSEIENRIINLIKSGKDDPVIELVDQMFEEGKPDSSAFAESTKFLLYEVCGTINRLYSSLGHKDYLFVRLYQKIDKFNQLDEVVEHLKMVFRQLAEEFRVQKDDGKSRMKTEILSYIERHMSSSLLGLTEMADEFGLSEVYFSQLFKEMTGENFSIYLERMRLEKAKELMLTEEETIEQIAKQVGYNSINTFHKAFKRVEGITPGAFKKQNKKSI